MRRFDAASLSAGNSVLARRDPRARLLAALVLLAGISLNHRPEALACIGLAAALALLLTRIRPWALVTRGIAILVLPLTFVVLQYLAGESERAGLLLIRTVLSASVILSLTAVTPVPELATALTSLGAPRPLTDTIQFVYRYLFVLSDQALRVRDAVSCRGGQGSLPAAAGSVGVLFARSFSRAEGIHRAMLSRGYEGRAPESVMRRPGVFDATLVAFALIASTAPAVVRWISHAV